MSSPVHDDRDKRSMYAPQRAREAPEQPPQAIVAAIGQLKRQGLRTAPPPNDDTADPQSRHFNQPERPLGDQAVAVDIEAAMADAVRAAWSPPRLEPVVMPKPPKARLGGPTRGMLARLAGAVGFAAAAALFVSDAIPLPSIDISLHASEGVKAASSFVQAFAMGEAPAARPAPVLVADASPAVPPPASALPASPPVSSSALQASVSSPAASASVALPADVLSAFASLDTAAVPQTRVPPGPKIESAASADQQGLDRDELAGLLKRGQTLLAEGDISSARLLLRRAADAGDAAAALTLAGTYDRAELAKLKVVGVAHDHAQAKFWYMKAVANGSADAIRRLQQLAQRAD